jgi:S-adenosylmethionine-diacylgycerolhomoserine-N-methlytransferase
VNASELRTLWQLVRGMPAAGSHAEGLARFYGPQAAHYDRFRERLLQGRAALIEALQLAPGERVIELGAGTGRNAEYYADRIPALASLELVDLCSPLLARARIRAARWPNVRVEEADATTYRPPEPVDCVYLSYALTMIPDWSRTIDNALRMLRPGGRLGVVDFYVAASPAPPGGVRHGLWTRRFWPWWFRHDGVYLSPHHLAALRSRLSRVSVQEKFAPVPYLPGLRVPYYVLTGTKP